MKTLNTFIWLGTILLLGLGSAAALEQEESVINTRNLGGPKDQEGRLPADAEPAQGQI